MEKVENSTEWINSMKIISRALYLLIIENDSCRDFHLENNILQITNEKWTYAKWRIFPNEFEEYRKSTENQFSFIIARISILSQNAATQYLLQT